MNEHWSPGSGEPLSHVEAARVLEDPHTVDALRRRPKTVRGERVREVLDFLADSGISDTDAIKVVTGQEPDDNPLEAYQPPSEGTLF